ncbi:dynactin subunit p25 [Purpureocillium lavendulum]|uniref:Dynactin subunit 5 n=1 Tax=Purpureocillium lavendulum TaxID=1247861 RepID=A0AB34FF80_9HYPO|nr:dynactin subunit p25 [Purpureocillium lavendulum]
MASLGSSPSSTAVNMSRRPAKGDYIETDFTAVAASHAPSTTSDRSQDTGNKVARKAILVGTQNIMLGGKTVIQPEVMIRGDLVRTAASSSSSSSSSAAAPATTTAVAIGRYCFLARGVLLRPPGRLYKGAFTYMPLRLGDHVFVGQGTVVQAATVGSHVHIGKGCAINEFAIIKDYVKVLDGTVVPAFMVIPSFSIVAGQPAKVVGEIPEGGHDEFELRELYKTVGNNPQLAAS